MQEGPRNHGKARDEEPRLGDAAPVIDDMGVVNPQRGHWAHGKNKKQVGHFLTP